jgi:hypothetical protein
MPVPLTVRDLLLEGEPLSPSDVLAGEGRLDNPVAWAVSLRPYAPAFPRMRGGELALVATENLARLDLPPTLAEVIQHLAQLDAAAVAVKGAVDDQAVRAAQELEMPLVLLPPDAQMHDIEQAVMQECAMRHALAEVTPKSREEWFSELLNGSGTTEQIPAGLTERVNRAGEYAVAFAPSSRSPGRGEPLFAKDLRLVQTQVPGGHAFLVSGDTLGRIMEQAAASETALGLGAVGRLHRAQLSMEEARLAATASALLKGGKPVRYDGLGADGLLLILHRDAPEELRQFVMSAIGRLVEHDEKSGVPLLPTLEAFIRHGARLRETAEALIVHRNTLAYRLDRATQIAGLDPRNPDERLNLELALRALPLIR